jgi:diphthine-ammonia ligase
MKVVASWSGGKDSCFACYKAIQQGFDVTNILTFMSSNGRSNFHGLNSELLDAQSEAIGIPLIKWKTTWDTYEQEFKNILRQLKTKGVDGLVTGDIYEVALHEEGWLGRVCKEVDIKPIKPLWAANTTQLLSDFINEGFKATVVKVKLDVMPEEWLGKQIDPQFLTDILKLSNVDPCGEGGEYHTVVTDGPIFNYSIEIIETKKMTHNEYGHLEIKSFKSNPKNQTAINKSH